MHTFVSFESSAHHREREVVCWQLALKSSAQCVIPVLHLCVTPVCYTRYVKTNQMPKERLMQAGLFFQRR